ncbi:C40 family peptidase [Pseudohoeflea coraliihabitans]|uniref:C40 family peptidase n=1 Tax=Pseudohoeflea coraliihabitans TaxID=2860393 RepID=A0ABS6WPS7_9HYPH|nr:C40 family peptidase [Pseudohoeflea sp. DP4N28-3]MBW3097775.1 C40 family peptidase [Pseudohoeflea sp. DP4N28-3]
MKELDHRLNAYRPDLADSALAGRVHASRFVEGQSARVTAAILDLRSRPRHDAGIETQLLFGEDVRVFDRQEGWAWVQCAHDGFVGYVAETGLADAPQAATTHIVSRPRTFLYPGPDLKLPPTRALSMASRLTIAGSATTRDTDYFLLPSGEALIAVHCDSLDAPRADDALAVAALFLETPYLWGGRSGFGIDCSGLVQMALNMTGRPAPRDSDMQSECLGQPIEPGRDGLCRGDLVFWGGHVALLEDENTILHASGGTMTVTREPLADAIERIRPLYGAPTGFRRP